jgi:hypothetical protein
LTATKPGGYGAAIPSVIDTCSDSARRMGRFGEFSRKRREEGPMRGRIASLAIIYLVAVIAWLVLAQVTGSRSSQQQWVLSQEMAGLWGS